MFNRYPFQEQVVFRQLILKNYLPQELVALISWFYVESFNDVDIQCGSHNVIQIGDKIYILGNLRKEYVTYNERYIYSEQISNISLMYISHFGCGVEYVEDSKMKYKLLPMKNHANDIYSVGVLSDLSKYDANDICCAGVLSDLSKYV